MLSRTRTDPNKAGRPALRNGFASLPNSLAVANATRTAESRGCYCMDQLQLQASLRFFLRSAPPLRNVYHGLGGSHPGPDWPARRPRVGVLGPVCRELRFGLYHRRCWLRLPAQPALRRPGCGQLRAALWCARARPSHGLSCAAGLAHRSAAPDASPRAHVQRVTWPCACARRLTRRKRIEVLHTSIRSPDT